MPGGAKGGPTLAGLLGQNDRKEGLTGLHPFLKHTCREHRLKLEHSMSLLGESAHSIILKPTDRATLQGPPV